MERTDGTQEHIVVVAAIVSSLLQKVFRKSPGAELAYRIGARPKERVTAIETDQLQLRRFMVPARAAIRALRATTDR